MSHNKFNIIKIKCFLMIWPSEKQNDYNVLHFLQCWIFTYSTSYSLLHLVNIFFFTFCFLLFPFPCRAQCYWNSTDRNISVLSTRNSRNCSHYFHLQMYKKLLLHIRFVWLIYFIIFLFFIYLSDQKLKCSHPLTFFSCKHISYLFIYLL